MVAGELLMGVDLGTSGVKVVLMQPGGEVRARTAFEYLVETPRLGWAEQRPATWVQNTLKAMHQVVSEAQIAPSDVAAIGLSGQMHGTVCVDKEGTPVRPAIIWADQRSRDQVTRLLHDLGAETLRSWTGNPLVTGFMLASWLWLREEEPETATATAHLLLPKDYLRYVFTGTWGSEPSDASASSLFDPLACCWSTPLLDVLAIDTALLPPVHPSAEIAGGLLPEIAEATGLLAGTPVVYGASDQACQALGQGVVEPGLLSLTIGTGGQWFAPLLQPVPDPDLRLHLFCHALPAHWHLEAAILSAGLSLRWLRDQVLAGSTYDTLIAMAETVPPCSEGLFFLPYLTGERTPTMDAEARGAFLGLTLRHNRGHLVRAVMEGVVFALRQGLEIMMGLGVPVEHVVASGGASYSPLWLQLQADILNCPIYRTQTVDAAAVGAALLAGVGAGVYPDAKAACRRTVRWHPEPTFPDPERAARYAAAYRAYGQLHQVVDLYKSALVQERDG